MLIFTFSNCGSDIQLLKEQAYFKSFTYTGNDSEFDNSRLQNDEIFNPILQGSYSDASICRKNQDYYMVTATYTFYPGVAVLHSTDLVNWEQIAYALPTEKQCLNTSLKSEQGVFPCTIRYSPKDGFFYITGTFVGGGGHFVIRATDPKGPWTDPEWLFGVGGVHTSLFIDDDNQAYLLNQGTPDRVPDYPDFKVIWLQKFDLATLKNIGERKIILAGGDIPEKKPSWLESPHIYKMGEYYYLTASEGGRLGNGFATCVYRSKNVWGPYKRYENNPILTQRRLTPDREDAVVGTGHVDMIDTQEGNWYAVFQGIRPYDKAANYNQGRETFMMPVQFEDGWPYIIRNGETVPLKIKAPNGVQYKKDTSIYAKYIPHGNFTYKETFVSEALPPQWFMLRTPVSTEKFKKENVKEGLFLPLDINNIRSIRHTAFVAIRQMHKDFAAETEMHFLPNTSQEFAGLALYVGDQNNCQFGITLKDDEPTLVLQKAVKQSEQIGKEIIGEKKLESGFGGRIFLAVERHAEGLVFKYKFNLEAPYETFPHEIPTDYLSCQKNGTFYGTVVGMYASKDE